MLSVKLGIPSPVGYNNTHPTATHATSISALESKMEQQIEKLRVDFQHQMQIMSLELKHTSEINELKWKLQLKETDCNKIMQNSSFGANSNTNTVPSNNWYGFSMRNTQQTNPPPNWYGMPTHTTYQPTPPPVYPHMRPQVVIKPYGRQPYQAMPATNLQHPPIPPFSQRPHHPYHTRNTFFRDRQSLDSGLANQNANIPIGTLNIQNIKGNSIYLQTILKSLDILCIQEHWILSLEKDIIKNINNDFISYVKSVDDDDPIIDHKAIRWYRGTAFFGNKDLEKSINIMSDGNNRIQVITINSSPSKTCLFNVYMPSLQVAGDLDYKEATDQISEIIEKYKDSY
ncbi:unnamed protein product [Mytilus coruscus]|uniref:Endonuclease/exonuclease/phosphatase domain-containing protein n=1 Tax=Mytilus coruscus TaxID=42192 RepID=A0A6J8DI39_MYTCO|nr:unnamed protein product [Mytilus coruscus]